MAITEEQFAMFNDMSLSARRRFNQIGERIDNIKSITETKTHYVIKRLVDGTKFKIEK